MIMLHSSVCGYRRQEREQEKSVSSGAAGLALQLVRQVHMSLENIG